MARCCPSLALLWASLLVLGAAQGSVSHGLLPFSELGAGPRQGLRTQGREGRPGSPGELVLLFSANVSAACSGRCRAAVSVRPCQPLQEGSASPMAAAAAQQIQPLAGGHTTMSLDRAAAELASVALAVECEAGCRVEPAALELWRGSACSGDSDAEGGGPPSATLLRSSSGNSSVALLNSGRALLEVEVEAALPRGDQHEGMVLDGGSAEATVQQPQDAESGAGLEMAAAGLLPPTAEPARSCLGRLAAQLLLVVWLLACPFIPQLVLLLVAR